MPTATKRNGSKAEQRAASTHGNQRNAVPSTKRARAITMGVVVATELSSCAGRASASSAMHSPSRSPAVSEEEAMSAAFLPAEALSAALISSHRILVTAGVLDDERVLPFSVLRYLDLAPTQRWTRPMRLRRRVHANEIPVPRVDHSLTYAPSGQCFLIGGMKVADPDPGSICKTVFALDTAALQWHAVDTLPNRSPLAPGPRFAHSAVYVALRPPSARSRSRTRAKPAATILLYGGYTARDHRRPCHAVHLLDLRTSRWTLRKPNPNALHAIAPPRRAYHAACVTESNRYFVVHGGNRSDDDDILTMSDMLFVFDLQTSAWSIPQLRPASDAPPVARRRHSLVNGVARHRGSLVLYGGSLNDARYSNDMFLCTIIEPDPDLPNTPVQVTWQRIDVRTAVHRPLATDADHISEKRLSERRTVAGGSLIAVPNLRKYVMIGGRGEYGVRESPLLLDPFDSDEIAASQAVAPSAPPPAAVDPPDEDEHVLPPIREREGATHAALSRKGHKRTRSAAASTARPSPRTRSGLDDDEDDDNRDAEEDKDNHNADDRDQENWDKGLDRDYVIKIHHDTEHVAAPSRHRKAARPRSALPSPEESRSGQAPLTPPYHGTPSDPSPVITPANPHQPKRGDAEGAKDMEPAVRQPTSAATPLRARPARHAKRTKKREQNDPAIEIDGTRGLVEREDKSVDMDLISPLSKRKRFHSPPRDMADVTLLPEDLEENQNSDAEPLDLDSSHPDISPVYRSQFVRASDLVRQAGNITAKSTRATKSASRGKGRGGSRTTRSAASEQVDATKYKEIQRLKREALERVSQLEKDNEVAQNRVKEVTKDNKDLNEQVKNLLDEVRSLRTQAISRDKGLVSAANGKSARNVGTGRGQPSSSEMDNVAAGTGALEAKVSELQTDLDKAATEGEELRTDLKEMEEEKRAVEKELNMSKTKMERIARDRESYQKELKSLHRDHTSMTSSKEDVERRARGAEEERLLLTREIENLKHDIREEQQRGEAAKLERSTAGGMMKTVEGKLHEANKRHDLVMQKERDLQVELNAEKESKKAVQTQLEKAMADMRRLEQDKVDVSVEMETVRVDLEKKVKECSASMKDAERSRFALDQERRETSNSNMDHVRLRCELEKSKRECEALRARRDDTIAALKRFGPRFLQVSEEMRVLIERAVTEEDAIVLSRARADARANGEKGKVASASCQDGQDANCSEVHEKEIVRNASEVRPGSEDQVKKSIAARALSSAEQDEVDEP